MAPMPARGCFAHPSLNAVELDDTTGTASAPKLVHRSTTPCRLSPSNVMTVSWPGTRAEGSTRTRFGAAADVWRARLTARMDPATQHLVAAEVTRLKFDRKDKPGRAISASWHRRLRLPGRALKPGELVRIRRIT